MELLPRFRRNLSQIFPKKDSYQTRIMGTEAWYVPLIGVASQLPNQNRTKGTIDAALDRIISTPRIPPNYLLEKIPNSKKTGRSLHVITTHGQLRGISII